jgi:rare lipoprotein A
MQNTVALLIVFGALALVGCSSSHETPTYTNGTPCHEKFIKKAYNRPYEIKGVTYHPQKHYNYSEVGIASFYGGGDVFHGRKTSNGEVFDMNRLSAAHKTVPIPCVVLVTNLENGRSIKLKINDRGPFIDGRIIDVSRKAARMLGFENKGLAKVRVETLVQDSIILADNMAKGSKAPMPLENTTMLVQNESRSKDKHPNSASVQLAGHSAPIPSTKANTLKNPTSQHSVYSEGPLPDIHLAAASQSARAKRAVSHLPPAPSQYQQAAYSSNQAQPVIQHAIATRRPPTQEEVQVMAQSGRVFIQAGTHARFTSAQAMATSLKTQYPHIPVKMHPIKVGSQQMFRVLVGPFKDNGHAQMLSRQMRGIDSRILKVVYE